MDQIEKNAVEKLRVLDRVLSNADYDELESRLRVRAAVLGWTGDPLRQFPSVVLGEIEAILRGRLYQFPGEDIADE